MTKRNGDPTAVGRVVSVICSVAALGGFAALAACDVNTPVYIPPDDPIETGAMGGTATQTVTLDFRQPTKPERDYLNQREQTVTTQPNDFPWLGERSIALSLQYTITNLSDKPGNVRVMIDGASEFALYDPGTLRAALAMTLSAEDLEDVFLPSLIETTLTTIPAKGKLTGNIREDDFAEAAKDLDAFGRFMGNYATLLIKNSDQTPMGYEMVPATMEIPQLQQIIVTLETTTQMRLDFVIRVRDERGQLAQTGEDIFRPSPTAFVPAQYAMMP